LCTDVTHENTTKYYQKDSYHQRVLTLTGLK